MEKNEIKPIAFKCNLCGCMGFGYVEQCPVCESSDLNEITYDEFKQAVDNSKKEG